MIMLLLSCLAFTVGMLGGWVLTECVSSRISAGRKNPSDGQ